MTRSIGVWAVLAFAVAVTIAAVVVGYLRSGSDGPAADGERRWPAIEAAIEEHGGTEALERARIGRVAYTLTVALNGAPATLSVTDVFALPGYLRREVNGRAAGEPLQMLYVSNQLRTWALANRVLTEFEMRKSIDGGVYPYALLQSLHQLRDPGVKITALPEARIGERAVEAFRTERDGLASTVYLDKETHRIVQVTGMLADPLNPSGPPVPMETSYSDYRRTGGMLLPMRFELKKNGEPYLIVKILDVRFLQSVDSGLFEKPAAGYDREGKVDQNFQAVPAN